MRIDSVTIKNFRLLSDVTLSFEPNTTVIVGRNNSGKTSLTELFRRLLLAKSPTFRLEDFSCGVHEDFWRALVAYSQGEGESKVRTLLPEIEVKIVFDYSDSPSDLGALSTFVVDLDTSCTAAVAIIRYALNDGEVDKFFDGLAPAEGNAEANARVLYYKEIKNRIPSLFKRTLHAVDPSDSNNALAVDWTHLQQLIQSGFINAQRWLDDTTEGDNDILGGVVEALFRTALSESADEDDRKAATQLDTAIQEVQQKLDDDINRNVEDLVPALSLFGYPGLSDPKLRTETTLDVKRLLTNHTKVRYEGMHGVSLPEAYNGLGARNLIFILLSVLEFFKAYKARETAPGVHLVFIEEPEAHLHPQMAEVFIRKLDEIAKLFATKFNDGKTWPVQFVVSTHSSHMANEARFETIRYFLAPPEDGGPHLRSAKIKDLRKGLQTTPAPDREFLHQYMTLTRCDLFFADKAALIEGCAERLLLPRMIGKIDETLPDGSKLSSHYVSVVEVCGAYAHLFFPLLDFLELRTLVITDLDTAKSTGGRLVRSKFSESSHTTNGCLKKWFSGETPSPKQLVAKPDASKIRGSVRLAYQVPEAKSKGCARSFEDAFMLANPQLFGIESLSHDARADKAYELAADQGKSEFALRHALEVPNWNVPTYIADGLRWLANPPVPEPASDARKKPKRGK